MPAFRLFRRRGGRPKRGAIAVEYALVLPVLIPLFVACVDFGRFAHSYIAVTNAARAGAGFASFHPFSPIGQDVWEEEIREAVRTELRGAFDEEELAKVEVPPPTLTTDLDGMTRVRVAVSYPFDTLIDWPFVPESILHFPVTNAVEMRVVRQL